MIYIWDDIYGLYIWDYIYIYINPEISENYICNRQIQKITKEAVFLIS